MFPRELYTKTELKFEFLEKYDSFLRSNNGSASGISIKMKTIRAVFNNAIKREIIYSNTYPFKHYKILALKKEAKREYLIDEELQKLIAEDFSSNKIHQFAKDMYLFSFYFRGMNFIDLLKLNNSNLYDEGLSYLKTKTGVHLDSMLWDYSLEILKMYNEKSMNSYLFPLLLNENMNIKKIKNCSHKLLGQINPALKEMMEILKISKHITFYTAPQTLLHF